MSSEGCLLDVRKCRGWSPCLCMDVDTHAGTMGTHPWRRARSLYPIIGSWLLKRSILYSTPSNRLLTYSRHLISGIVCRSSPFTHSLIYFAETSELIAAAAEAAAAAVAAQVEGTFIAVAQFSLQTVCRFPN